MYNIEDLTEQARRSGASDIHLVCGLPPKYRLDGQLENMAEERLSEKDCDMLCQDLAKDAMYEKLEYTGELDFSREIRGIRCRCHVFKQQGKVSAAIRLLSESIPRLDSLGLPPSALEFTSLHKGIVLVTGETGSGKSTTVRCMNFLEEPTSGNVYIDGQKLTHANKTKIIRESISMVFQQFNLYPHMTVLKNLTIAPMKLHHKSKKEAEDLAYHYLDVVGLRDKAHVYPTTLSGGQQQRIAIARALCAQTKIILFDEPTSALDPETIQEVLDVMIKLAKENITMVVVTHEMGFARQVADRIVFMADGQIIEEGTPDHFFDNPSNERVKQFLGKIIR